MPTYYIKTSKTYPYYNIQSTILVKCKIKNYSYISTVYVLRETIPSK